MWKLPRIIVNPPSLRGDIVGEYLIDGIIYGKNEKRSVALNVLSGALEARMMPRLPKVTHQPVDQISKPRTMEEYEYLIKVRREMEEAGSDHGLELLEGVKLQVVISLANHRVNGDQLMKGLKARGIHLDVRFQESFLGGWNVTDANGVSLSLDSLLRMIPSEHREE